MLGIQGKLTTNCNIINNWISEILTINETPNIVVSVDVADHKAEIWP